MTSARLGFLLIAGSGSIAQQGPHLAPVDAPARLTVAGANEPGIRLRVSGVVVGPDGQPLANASIYLYHTDAKGEYVPGQSGGSDRPRLFGYLRSDARGRYEFETIKPGSYPNSSNPAHIHFEPWWPIVPLDSTRLSSRATRTSRTGSGKLRPTR